VLRDGDDPVVRSGTIKRPERCLDHKRSVGSRWVGGEDGCVRSVEIYSVITNIIHDTIANS
jgi:hypothetical protein